jgi:hypothetical protein
MFARVGSRAKLLTRSSRPSAAVSIARAAGGLAAREDFASPAPTLQAHRRRSLNRG